MMLIVGVVSGVDCVIDVDVHAINCVVVMCLIQVVVVIMWLCMIIATHIAYGSVIVHVFVVDVVCAITYNVISCVNTIVVNAIGMTDLFVYWDCSMNCDCV